MSTYEDVKTFIDTLYAGASERPRMYFSSAESFEDAVFLLETLREWLSHEKPTLDDMKVSKYTEFLIERGFQSASFTTANKNIEDFVVFLNQYLQYRRATEDAN